MLWYDYVPNMEWFCLVIAEILMFKNLSSKTLKCDLIFDPLDHLQSPTLGYGVMNVI